MNQTQQHLNDFLRCFLQINEPVSHLSSATYHDDHDHDHDHDEDEHDHDHDHEHSDKHDLLVAKAIAMVVLFCASAICGSVPFLLDRCFRWTENQTNARSALVVKCLLYFGGGVLLATTFLHLLPEVQELVESLQDCEILPALTFPLAELLMCCGFFLMYFIEEAIHAYIHHNQKRDAGAAAAFERGHSVRNSHLVKRPTAERATAPTAPEAFSENDVPSTTLSVQDLLRNDAENQKYNDKESTSHACHHHQIEPYNQTHTHTHTHSHHHTHLPMNGDAADGSDLTDVLASSLRGLFIVLALSLHELFEGMAIGLEQSASSVWFMFGAVSAHKLVLAFCVGVELIVAQTRIALSIVYVLTFAIVSPLGIGIGILISQSQDETGPSLVSAILQGFACGTLLYVVFFEILSKNRAGLRAYLALFVGFLIMFGLQQLGAANGHGHSHSSCTKAENTDARTVATGEHRHTHQHEHRDSASSHEHSASSNNNNYEAQLKILRQVTQRLLDSHHKQE